MVDLSYALDIYDEFASTYVSNVQNYGMNLYENDSEIESFNDVDYVEGLWTGSDHENIVSYAGNIYSLTYSELYYIKIGAIANDNYWTGAGAYPYLHGYYLFSNYAKNNYIASYSYLMRSAIAGDFYYTTQTVGNVNKIYNTCNWTIDNLYPATNVKKLVLVGMAIHCGTDIFAHCATDKADGKIITHYTNDATHKTGADSTSVVPERFYCAKILARYSIKRYLGYYSTLNPCYDVSKANDWYNAGMTEFTLYNFNNYFTQATYY